MGLSWSELAVAEQPSVDGERLRTRLLTVCAWTPIDGVPLIVGAVDRGWKHVLNMCLLHVFPQRNTLTHVREPIPAARCCQPAAVGWSHYASQMPPVLLALHQTVLRSPPSVFCVWDEWDNTVNCMPLHADPGWAFLWYTWIQQRQPVTTDTVLGWCIALQRMRVEHIAQHLSQQRPDFRPFVARMRELLAHDNRRDWQFHDVPTRLQQLEAL